MATIGLNPNEDWKIVAVVKDSNNEAVDLTGHTFTVYFFSLSDPSNKVSLAYNSGISDLASGVISFYNSTASVNTDIINVSDAVDDTNYGATHRGVYNIVGTYLGDDEVVASGIYFIDYIREPYEY